jgi:hypothetical protein
VRISDEGATWIGRVTGGAVIVAVIAFIGAMLLQDEYPGVTSRSAIAMIIVAIGSAWAVAYVTMVVHQRQSTYVSADDTAEWADRQGSKLGGLVPFIYLLAGAEQRRILSYLRGKPAGKARGARP